MIVDAHIIAWNESETIHLTIKHYQKFCRQVYIYDNFSDDNTREIAESSGCVVKLFGIKGMLSDVEYTRLKNNCWKGSDADFVIVCDADEILAEPAWSNSATIYRTFGWQVFSNDVPRGTWLDITTGFHDPNYSKFICFSPSKIQDINFIHGCHVANPKGTIMYSDQITPLFHYRNVGGVDRLIKRHALYRHRLSPHNIKWNMGSHYLYSDERRKMEWDQQYRKSVEFSPDFILQSQTEINR